MSFDFKKWKHDRRLFTLENRSLQKTFISTKQLHHNKFLNVDSKEYEKKDVIRAYAYAHVELKAQVV